MRRRIIISLGLLLAVCLFGDVAAMFCLNRTVRQLSDLAKSYRIQSMRDNLVASAVRVELDMLAHLAGHGQHAADGLASEERLASAVNQCGGCHRDHTPVIRAQLDGISQAVDSYRRKTAIYHEGGDAAAQAGQEGLRIANQLVTQATSAAELAQRHLVVRSADVRTNVDQAKLVLFATLVAALMFGGFVAWQLKRRLTRPVESLLDGIEKVGRGDLNYRFSTDADEEFRQLATALNDAYRDLNEAHESILQAEKLAAVGKLAAGVAHEVSNPLASISSIAQMMKRRCAPDERTDQLDLIMTEIQRISRVVRELLTFSRPASAERRDRVDLKPLIEHAAKLLEYDNRAKNVDILREYDDNLVILGDSDRLLLIFTNVIINAIDAMTGWEGGTHVLKITANGRNAHVHVQFEDTGPGMTTDQIRQACEPFFTTKEPGKGTGLGLWTCYQTVQKHGGQMRIESQPNEGTTVHIELPCAPATEKQRL